MNVNSLINKGVRYYLLFVVALIVIANIGILQELRSWTEIVWSPSDKLMHFLLYGLFSFVVIIGLTKFFNPEKAYFIGIPVALLISIGEEFSNMLIDTRTFSWKDMTANITGVFLFGFLCFMFLKYRTTILKLIHLK
jgi:VanZ family protein